MIRNASVPMKTPITYYGGKQRMLKHILPLIPTHTLYSEVFCGGAAVLWAKTPSKVEVINDTNEEVVNFYQVLKMRFQPLQRRIDATCYSRRDFEKAWHIYQYPRWFTKIDRAWAFWLLCAAAFASKIGGSWGYGRTNDSVEMKFRNKKAQFTEELTKRIEGLQIECRDANQVILSRDWEEAFHYLDPPYVGSNCGHYAGYTQEDFNGLLNTLENVKGKFLLSSYDNPVLKELASTKGWKQIRIGQSLAVNGKATSRERQKVEVLTANYL